MTLQLNATLLHYVQLFVEVEHFDAATVSVFFLLAAVMGDEIALMEVMRLDVQVQLPACVGRCFPMHPTVAAGISMLPCYIMFSFLSEWSISMQ